MGLDFLNRICKVIHTDLKPENVLLCLTDREIKRVYGREQKKKLLLYEERLNFYRTNYKLGEPINLVEWAKLLKLQDKQWEEAASDGDKA